MEALPDGKKSYRVFLVTNRHVFENERKAFVRFNPEGSDPAREYNLDLIDNVGTRLWLPHPDKEVDVAVIGINVALLREHSIKFAWFRNDQHALDRKGAASKGVSEGDSVFVLGFPLGLVGEGRNFVVTRQGVVARVRDCIEGLRKEFLIDCSIFPGNSGGPVVTRPEIVSIRGTEAVKAAHLLGIVAGYVPYRDVAISSQTKQPRIVFEENSGLASVFPLDYVDDVIRAALSTVAPTPVAQEAAPPERDGGVQPGTLVTD